MITTAGGCACCDSVSTFSWRRGRITPNMWKSCFNRCRKQSLSQAVMETLAVIAYRQPVTKAEIELIRGVKCDYSVQMLVSRGLIEEVGRKEALGRPILYGTTDAFLRHFCLTSLADLPEIDFSALADRIAEAEAKQAAEKPKADPVDKLAQNIASEAAEE